MRNVAPGSDRDGLVIKEIRSKRDLSDYLVRFVAGDDFERLGQYLDITEFGRAAAFDCQNFACSSPEAVLAEMRFQQRRPVRKGGRTAYHYVISARGRTDPATMIAMGRRLTQLIGLDRQRAIFAVHTDTANSHLHIAVAALDDGGRQIILEKGYTHTLLAHANAQLCHEFGRRPEASLGFKANEKGVFRTSDGHMVRDAKFTKVSRDLRWSEPARTPVSAKVEAETGFQSLQTVAAEFVQLSLPNAIDISEFVAVLSSHGFDYRLSGSGATISAGRTTFKASQISHRVTPRKLAERFGVVHLTATKAKAQGLGDQPGFFKRTPRGGLEPIELLKCRRALSLVEPEELYGQAAADARARAEREAVREARFPAFEPIQAEPLRLCIETERQNLSMTAIEDCERDDAAWRLDRLIAALRRMEGKVRGRPPRQLSQDTDRQFAIPARSPPGLILYERAPPIWWIEPWRVGDRIVAKGSVKAVYRGCRVVATFSATMATLHTTDDADLRAALKQAHKQFGPDLKIFGDRKFRRQLTQLAIEEGIVLTNPELASYQKWLLEPARAALSVLGRKLDAAINGKIVASKLKLQAVTKSAQAAVGREMAMHSNRLAAAATSLAASQISLAEQIQDREARRQKAAEAAANAAADVARRERAARAERERRAAELLTKQQREKALATAERKRAERREFERRKAERWQRYAQQMADFARASSLATPRIANTHAAVRRVGGDGAITASRVPLDHGSMVSWQSAQSTQSSGTVAPQSQPQHIDKAASAPAPPVQTRLTESLPQSPIEAPLGPMESATSPANPRAGRGSDDAFDDHSSVTPKHEMERTYALWKAQEQIAAGIAFGSVANGTLVVDHLQTGQRQSFDLTADEARDALHIVQKASHKLDEVAQAARAGLIVLDSSGRPAAANAASQNFAERASYLWRHKTARELLCTEIREGEADRKAAREALLVPALIPLNLPDGAKSHLCLVATARRAAWDPRAYNQLDLAAAEGGESALVKQSVPPEKVGMPTSLATAANLHAQAAQLAAQNGL